MSERLFGTNGFRGVVGELLTPQVAVKFGYAVGTHYHGGRVLVGWDSRTSGEMLSRALISGLLSTGAEVLEVGLTPIPALQKYVKEKEEVDYGVMVTASHNPPEYNGFKVIGPEGIEAHDSVEKAIEEVFVSGEFVLKGWREMIEVKRAPNVVSFYMDKVLEKVETEVLRSWRMRVVLDPGHGVSTLTVPYLLSELGYDVTTINGELDGTFPLRPPEPRPDNLMALSKTVKALNADLGVAYDGDGDRAIFCDEKGKIWWGDASGITIAKYLAEKGRCDTVITPVTSTAATESVLNSLGVEVFRTRVGSRNVSYLMKEKGSTWGFEENGGGIYAPHLLARDGGMTTMLFVQVLAEKAMKTSELFMDLPKLHQVKTKIRCETEKRGKLIEELIEKYGDRRIETIDGLKVWFRDDSWALIRPSGTEPIIRIFVESSKKDEAEAMVRRFTREVEEISESLGKT